MLKPTAVMFPTFFASKSCAWTTNHARNLFLFQKLLVLERCRDSSAVSTAFKNQQLLEHSAVQEPIHPRHRDGVKKYRPMFYFTIEPEPSLLGVGPDDLLDPRPHVGGTLRLFHHPLQHRKQVRPVPRPNQAATTTPNTHHSERKADEHPPPPPSKTPKQGSNELVHRVHWGTHTEESVSYDYLQTSFAPMSAICSFECGA